jgi:hypothetical protein
MQATEATTARPVTKVDPRLQPIVDYMSNRIELAIEKATAHHTNPAKYPLPADPDALESVLHRRLTALSPDQQRTAVTRVMPQATAANEARIAKFGGLARLKLESDVPIAKQARDLSILPTLKMTAVDLKELLASPGVLRTRRFSPLGGPAPVPEVRSLELLIHKVNCVDDTSEARKDEISLGGALTNLATGETTKADPRSVGEFKTGTVKEFTNPIRFPAFNLTEGDTFPKTYLALVDAAEVDFGGFSDVLDKLVDGLSAELNVIIGMVVASITAGGTAGSLVGPIGTIIGLIAGAVFAVLFALLKQLWADEVFEPEMAIPVVITSLTDRFPGGALESAKEVLVFLGFGGHYEVTTSWRLA